MHRPAKPGHTARQLPPSRAMPPGAKARHRTTSAEEKPMCTTDIMLDLETWGTSDTAAIRALAAVAFDPRRDDIHDIHDILLIDATPSIDDQIEHGRTLDPGTVKWWRNQKTPLTALLAEQDPEHIDTLAGILNRLENFLIPWTGNDTGCIGGNVWTRGHFDAPILLHAWRTFDPQSAPPWKYWQEKDVRTLDVFIEKKAPERPDDPLSDCMAQIASVRMAHSLAAMAAESTCRSAAA